MNLQRFEEVSEAADRDSFQRALVGFANELDFPLVMAVLAIEHRTPRPNTEYLAVGNTPAAFVAASQDPENAKRDPVHKRLMRLSKPFIYDQDLYVKEQAGDLWEMQAPFGYKTGVAVSVHMPGYKRLLLGVDRDKPLPKDETRLTRLMADLQLLAVHAQEAASRVLPSRKAATSGAPKLSPVQIEILKLTMENKSAWVVGAILGMKEATVAYHIKEILKKLDTSSKHHAVLKAIELGLI